MIIVLLLFSFQFVCYGFVLDLSKEKWDVVNKNGSIHLNGVKIPGVIHTHLLEAKIIGEPYFRYNDVYQRWVGEDEWTYSIQSFNIDKMYSKMFLVCEGLDTVAEITLNKVKIASTDNMFQKFTIDVTESLHTGTNTLSIKFLSPIKEAASRYNNYPYEVPASDNVVISSGEPHRNFLRKEQCSYSWDWGPCFTPSGVYKDISIVGFDEMNLDYFSPSVDCTYASDATDCSIYVDIQVTSEMEKKGVKITVDIQDLSISKDFEVDISAGVKEYQLVMKDVLKLKDNQLWWPSGYGTAQLYELSYDFSSGLSSGSLKIGFRDVDVVTKPISGQKSPKDDQEETFYFQVNGLPIFAKGANFIPMNSFEDQITNNEITTLIQTAFESNMNMIRVWGGGLYQRDEFYNLCDEYGLLVWQEFMFACSLYPTDSHFLDTVSAEVKDQLLRLKHHPSIALWSGSNENEASLWDKTWYVGTVTPENKIMYGIDYAKLYFDTVRPVVEETDPYRFFWISSPSNGIISENPYQGKWTNPYSFDQGDVHYYNYVLECTDVTNFPTGKFISEYGWQSFPAFTTLSHVILPEDYDIEGDLMEHRQHHPLGTEQIIAMLGWYFKPTDWTGEEKFKSNIYLSQLLQSFCIKAETEYYRTLIQSHQTMGALYWQLNSIWQAPTWSSLEYGGKWKILHYEVKKFFAPVMITSYEHDKTMNVFLVSDLLEDVSVDVTLQSVKWSDGKVSHSESKTLTMKYLETNQLVSLSTDVFLKNYNCSRSTYCFLLLSATYTDPKSGDTVTNENYHLFSPLYQVNLAQPSIQYTLKKMSDDSVQVNMEATNLAPFVFLDVDQSGKFSENSFFLYPGVNKTVTFQLFPGAELDYDQFQKTFEAISIRDTYEF